jgi:hypothetical protein
LPMHTSSLTLASDQTTNQASFKKFMSNLSGLVTDT